MPLDAYFANGTNYETVRLIALSDRVLGRDSNYDVLFDSAVEAIREDPETYARGVADVFWEFLMQRPLREEVAPREQTAPEPPAPTFESDGVVLPNPQATVLRRRRPVRVRVVRIGLHRLVHPRGPVAGLGRPGRPGALPRGRLAGAGLGRRAPVPDRRRRGSRRSSTGSRRASRARRFGSRSAPSRWCGGGRGAGGRSSCSGPPPRPVLLIHAASQGVAPEFALPLYPLFIVTALGALAGERGGAARRRRLAPPSPLASRGESGRTPLEERDRTARDDRERRLGGSCGADEAEARAA